MVITIYKTDICPSSRAVLMLADFLQLNYAEKNIDIAKEEHKTPEFIKKNPLSTIPLLEDGDFILAEGHAIMKYLVSKYGADLRAELYPSDLTLRATIDQRLFFDASVLLPNCNGIINCIINNKESGPSDKQILDATTSFDILEKYLEATRFVACDYLTIADVAIIATLSVMKVFIPVDDKYTKIHLWLDLLKEQDWYQPMNQLVDTVKTGKSENLFVEK